MPNWVCIDIQVSRLQSLIRLQDINRERTLAKVKLPALLDRLTEEEKADLAIGVLCNLCLDYGTLPSISSKQPG